MFTQKLIIFAIICPFLFAAQSHAKNDSPPATRASIITPTSTFAPPPGYSADPCYDAKDQNVAAFCAQWKAADAAQSSADATWWTVYLGGSGLALAVITMAAAIAAAYFAKKAADETKRGADAAHNANRPWLDIDLKLHNVSVNFDRKGYCLQLELTPLNAGTSPATDVREHVECLLYDHIPSDDEASPFAFSGRDRGLQKCAATASSKLLDQRDAGPTVFPARDQPFYIETFVPWDWDSGYPTPIAWLIAGLRYSFPDGTGETIKVFSVRSFGFPDSGGFECLGNDVCASVKIDPVVTVWPRYGSVK